jgi:hypothetical protein
VCGQIDSRWSTERDSCTGYSTLSIDFQATGESPGEIITFGWRERFDVLAAVQTVRGAATLLAAPELDVQAVILEAVYPSLDVAVENRLRLRFGSVGAALSPLLLLQLRPRLGIEPADLKPVDPRALRTAARLRAVSTSLAASTERGS